MQSHKILISVDEQKLYLTKGNDTLRVYPISTSGFGIGTEEGSNKTPPGKFRISEKIGDAQPKGMVFKSRIPTGNLMSPEADEDQVVSRILWLEGMEDRNLNTKARYIYIHGTNHEETIGTPCSHGCIRMLNADVIELFDLVECGTEVAIRPPADRAHDSIKIIQV